MTMTTFHPVILNSQNSLRRFLNGEAEAAAIARSQVGIPPFAPRQVSRIDTEGLYFLVSNFFLTVASYFTYAVCMKSLSRRLWVMSRHEMSNATALKTQSFFQNNLLTRSINIHRKDTQDFYQLPSQAISLQPNSPPRTLNFFQERGSCRGMCFWFAHLYFKTKNRFANSDQHVRAVGQQFAKGAPRQAALVHALHWSSAYDLLGLRVFPDYSQIFATNQPHDQIIRSLQCRVAGVYGIYTSSHQVIYIKSNDNRQYLFDPNQGCIKVHTSELFKNAMKPYLNSHKSSEQILVDQYSPHIC